MLIWDVKVPTVPKGEQGGHRATGLCFFPSPLKTYQLFWSCHSFSRKTNPLPIDLAKPKEYSSSNYWLPTASVVSAKAPASLAPGAKGLAVGPAFYVPREGFSPYDDSHFILCLKMSPQWVLEMSLFASHCFVPSSQGLQASLEILGTYFSLGCSNQVIKSDRDWTHSVPESSLKALWGRYCFPLFSLKIFIYWRGCFGSYLRHMGSLLCHEGSFIVVHGL